MLKFQNNYLDINTIYFVENYITLKLKCCMMKWSIFYFFRLLIIGFILKKNTFKSVIKLVYALFVYMVLYL